MRAAMTEHAIAALMEDAEDYDEDAVRAELQYVGTGSSFSRFSPSNPNGVQ